MSVSTVEPQKPSAMSRKKAIRAKLFKDEHHLVPRSRGGSCHHRNKLWLWRKRHEAWHNMWGNDTLDEIVAHLSSLAKRYKRDTYAHSRNWVVVFGKKDVYEALELLHRVAEIKLKQRKRVVHERTCSIGRYAS